MIPAVAQTKGVSMTAPATIPYFSKQPQTCPLCRKRPMWKKMIYGHPVCKKCFYAFANRRQLAYLVDALIVLLPNIAISMTAVRLLRQYPINWAMTQVAMTFIGLPMMCLFLMKDGFTGQSPGKRATGVLALDDKSSQPIGFGQSFKRNSILLVGMVPIIGGLFSLVVVLIIAMQVARGYRLGDRFAGTRVIWKKYAHLPVFGGDALVCEQCGYDLQGNVSGVCPECGTAISEHNAQKLAVTDPVIGS